MSQLHGINGAQQPQATGISPSVGKLGLHSVQLGTNPPVRLDAIKGNKIPFAGFRTATKVVNAKTGARENAALALRSLASPDGKLDAKALLNAAKSMQTHLNRLGTLGEIRGTMDDAVIAAFAPEVESLSNTELLNAYQQFLSPEMSLLKRALQAEMSANPRNEDVMAAAANLFSLEALVTKEASNRIIIAQGLAQPGQIPPLSAQYGAGIEGMGAARPHEAPADMSAVSMHVLMDVAIDSSARRERVGGLVADMASRRNLGNIDARQFGDVLRSAGLTINVDLGFLFGMNGPKPLLKAGGAWEHIFHSIEAAPDEASRQAAIDVKGAGYIQKRDNVERGLFPELSEDRPVVANERPTYAALNLLRQRTGAAPTYGTVALHLKPEVARRATYTVDDTFVALRLRYTEAGRQAVLDLLPGSPGISEAHKLDLDDRRERAPPAPRRDIRRHGRQGGIPGGPVQERVPAVRARGRRKQRPRRAVHQGFQGYPVHAQGNGLFRQPRNPAPRAGRHGRRQPRARRAGQAAARHGPRRQRMQLHRSTSARPHRFRPGCGGNRHQQGIRARSAPAGSKGMVQCRGRRARRQAARRRGHGRFFGGAAGRTCRHPGTARRRGYPWRALKSRFRSWISKNTVRSEERAFYAAHLDQARIDAKLHDVQQDDAGLQAFISQMLSIRPGGAAVSRILGTVPLVAGGDAQNVREAFAAYVEQYRHVPLRGQHTEDDVLQDAMWQAVSDVMGKGRLDSLAAIEELTADPAQRATLRDFVMGHPPMSGQAFRALASAALQGAGVLNGLAPAEGEPLDDEAMLTRFGGAAASFRRSFDAMPEEERDAAGEGRLLQAFGGLAFSLMRDASPEVSGRVAERLNGPAMRGLSGVLLRLGDAERGFPQDAGFRDALAFNAFQSGLRAALGGRADPPAAFAGELSLIPQADRGRLHAALPGLADTLDASFPARPAFPPAQAGKLAATPAQHRDFLLSMLPIYHDHERPGAFDHGAAYHGRGHICRAFIFASTMAGLMEEMGHTVDRTALLPA